MQLAERLLNPCRHHACSVRREHGGICLDFAGAPLPDLRHAEWQHGKRSLTWRADTVFVKGAVSSRELWYGLTRIPGAYGVPRGLAGEFASTVEAHRRGVPVHRPLALRFAWRQPCVAAYYERLRGMESADEILGKCPERAAAVLQRVMTLVELAVSRGIFHGDPNVTNVFLSDDLQDAVFIDLENTLVYSCDRETALAFALAKLWARHTQKHLTREQYLDIVTTYLHQRPGERAANDLLAEKINRLVLMDENARTSGRDRRLRAAVLRGLADPTVAYRS